jgi:hypothetical protein
MARVVDAEVRLYGVYLTAWRPSTLRPTASSRSRAA